MADPDNSPISFEELYPLSNDDEENPTDSVVAKLNEAQGLSDPTATEFQDRLAAAREQHVNIQNSMLRGASKMLVAHPAHVAALPIAA